MTKEAELPMLLSGFVNEYLEHELGRSPNTIASYSASLLLFILYASKVQKKDPDQLTLADLTSDLLLEFLRAREALGCSARTRNQRLAGIKAFFRYVSRTSISGAFEAARVGLVRSKKMIGRRVCYLTQIELDAVLASTRHRTPWDLRDKAILATALACGLRASELLSLTLSAIDLGPNPSVTVMGKGRKRRVQPLSKSNARCLRDWLELRSSSSPVCFVNSKGDALTNDGLSYIVKKYATLAAVAMPSIAQKNVTPHTLRHTCAMAVLRATKDIRQVALWLGHASVQSAEIYLHADPLEKLRILEAHPGLGIKAGNFKGRTPDILSLLKSKRLSSGPRHQPR